MPPAGSYEGPHETQITRLLNILFGFFHWGRISREFPISTFDSEIGLMLDLSPKAEGE